MLINIHDYVIILPRIVSICHINMGLESMTVLNTIVLKIKVIYLRMQIG